MEDQSTKSKLQYNEVFCNNNIQLMNLCYQLGKYWLHSYIQLPHAQSYNKTTVINRGITLTWRSPEVE